MQITCVYKHFEIKSFAEYHNLYLKSNTLLFVKVFNNFRNTSLKIYRFSPVKFPSATGITWQVALKKG